MGALAVGTSRDSLRFPAESTEQSEFAITAEEGDAEEDEPTFTGVDVTVYRFTKLVKVTVQLLADQAANLDQFLTRSFARKMSMTENKYFIAGTGSGQPQGALVGGTAGLTLDAIDVIGATEVPELFYKLASEYREEAAWTMQGATEGYLRGLTGNPFQFSPTPAATVSGKAMDGLLNRPVFNSAYMGALGTSTKSLLIGNWGFYGIAERQNLVVQRLNELYAVAGYVGLLASFRLGGAVLIGEAFQYATHPSS